MRRHFAVFIFIAIVFITCLFLVREARADWRWAPPQFKKTKVVFNCADLKCIKKAYKTAKHKHIKKLRRYNQRRLEEWRHWTHLYIPQCTWYGESGYGPEYDPARYTMWNTSGSGARGKFQFMDGTYHANAKYHDWSALDQEIAARREYWKHDTQPWSNCG